MVAEDKQQEHPFPEEKPETNSMLMSMMEAFSTKEFKEKVEMDE